MRFSLTQVILIIGLILAIFGVGLFYKKYSDLQKTEKAAEQIEKKIVEEPKPAIVVQEPCLSTHQYWGLLQQKLKDTVAQVFSQTTEFNWVEPYKSPNQAEMTGTAFFINESGELITNAHVIDQARIVYIQIPSLGKRRFEVSVVGVSPERDLALLKLKPNEVEAIKKELSKNTIPFLKLGDSDSIHRADEIMALGYPLGQQGLKSTTGVVSGREHLMGQYFIQIDAALNKGNSGGPSLDYNGYVIGVNSAIIPNAQNVGYIIPINEVKLFIDQVRSMPEVKGTKLLRKPFLGVFYNNANENITAYLKNPEPGGLFVVEVYEGSLLYKSGVRAGDMIYKINGYPIDIYGEMNVPWSKEDKVSIIDFVSRLKIGEELNIEYYRKGLLKKAKFKFDHAVLQPIRRMYPGYEKIDYEVIGGLVIMPLSLNHVVLLAQFAPELMQYMDVKKHAKPVLLITHVMINSPASKARCIGAGSLISKVNDIPVRTLDEFRDAVTSGIDSGFLTIKTTENIFVALPLKEIVDSEKLLASIYYYPLSQTYHELAKRLKGNLQPT